MSLIGETAGKPVGEVIKDTTDASFAADVLDASREQPVIVDFWATWCGPCRQLGPALEKAVIAAKGAVKLVKVDIDKNPAYAGQLRVQSIPAVFAFVDGKPVDGFMGALPESQVKDFVAKLAKLKKGGSPLDDILSLAKESFDLGDMGGAAQAYAQVLQSDPAHPKALGGLAKVYLATGDAERAGEVVAMAPEGARDADLDSVRAALALAAEAPSDTGAFEARLARDPDDHEARFELAKALAGQHRLGEAAEQLLTILEKDRTWNDEAARKQLLLVFEAAGPVSEVARNGRRRLSAILFS
ncbi:MAG: tetratricopeptide repeat protein [Phenylobacterium sp.]